MYGDGSRVVGAGKGTAAGGVGDDAGGGSGGGVGVEKAGDWTVARPPTPFVDEDGVSKGWYELEMNGWIFRSQERPIAGETDRRAFRAALELERGIPLPEQLFAHNYVELVKPEVGIRLHFNPLDALRSWNELQHETSVSEDGTVNASNFDWTYSHDYRGAVDVDRTVFRGLLRAHKLIEAPYFGRGAPTSLTIPDDRLRDKGHIHYYCSIDLWQDELHDRGCCQLQVKVRVMKDLFLVLVRSFLRVDGKKVRLVDVRIFHDFSEAFLLRETTTRSATMEELRKLSEGHRPFSASVQDKAQRDERFFAQADQVYDLVAPFSTDTEIIAISVT